MRVTKMTNKVLKWFRISSMAICTGIVFVQFVYAVLWAINNGNNIQDFYDTSIYIAQAESFVSDGWRLIGYSIYVRLFMILEGVLDNNYVLLIYISQLLISFFSYAYGCRILTKLLFKKDINFKWMFIPAVYILTIPIVWQMQFAILPDAICTAGIVLLFSIMGECLWNVRAITWKKLLVTGFLLLLIGFMHRHYFYGALLLIVTICLIILLRMIRKKYRDKRALFTILVLITCVLLTSVISNVGNAIIPKSGIYVDYSLTVDLWKRFVYPNLYENYPYYTEDITDILPEHIAKECDEQYEYYMNNMGPMIADMYPEQAENVYWELVKSGFILHKSTMVKQVIKENIAYAIMPLAMEKYMYNNGNSLYGYNFTRMYEQCSNLTSDYMHIGMNGFFVVAVISTLMCLVDILFNVKRKQKSIWCLLYCIVSVISVTIPIMLLSFAKFDYRIGMFSTIVWGMIATLNIFEYIFKKQELISLKNNKSI